MNIPSVAWISILALVLVMGATIVQTHVELNETTTEQSE